VSTAIVSIDFSLARLGFDNENGEAIFRKISDRALIHPEIHLARALRAHAESQAFFFYDVLLSPLLPVLGKFYDWHPLRAYTFRTLLRDDDVGPSMWLSEFIYGYRTRVYVGDGRMEHAMDSSCMLRHPDPAHRLICVYDTSHTYV